MTNDVLEDRIRAGLWGVLVGDALGVPHEFKTPVQEPIDMVMPPDYRKTFPRVPYGTWSDDGALTLALLHTLTTTGQVDLNHFAGNLVSWFTSGTFTVDRKAYDIGGTTAEAVLRLMRGHSPEKSGLAQETANGNGSLMRTLPLALFHQGTDAELYTDACRVSAVTHAHDISMASCGVYCITARYLLNGTPPATALVQGLKSAHIPLAIMQQPTGSGYVLDTLSYAVMALRFNASFEAGLLGAVSMGADTDTTAAVAGGLIGVRDGMSVIPSRWFENLRGKDIAGPLIDALVQMRLAPVPQK